MNPINNPHKETAVVIGGGIVGVCCSLYLQREGYQVVLVDPAAPGDSTAKWSCGSMAVSEIIPLSKPGILKKIPGWLLDQQGPLALRPSAIPSIMPWFMRFLSCARESKIHEIANDLSHLTNNVYADYQPLLDDCEEKELLGKKPVMEVFNSAAGLAEAQSHIKLRENLGFKIDTLNAEDIADLEPLIAGKFDQGLLFSDWRSVNDTEGFIAALTRSFETKGGVRVRNEVAQLLERENIATGIKLASGRCIEADNIVVAAGNGSKTFFSQLGVNVPLLPIAGYQVVVPTPDIEFRHSVIYADGGFCYVPMTRGLQIGGTIEFSGQGSKPNFKRAEIILNKAKELLPQMNTNDVEFGVGYRPFLPDTKPVIDTSKRLKNVFMAFGHGQLGLTLGATTGRLICDLVSGREPEQDLTPFRADRF